MPGLQKRAILAPLSGSRRQYRRPGGWLLSRREPTRGYVDEMTTLLISCLIGVVAGLRTMTPIAAVSWAAWSGHLQLGGAWLAFLGYGRTPWIASALALVELVTDQLPTTPSRKTPVQFGARIVMGAVAGAALAAPAGALGAGAAAGVVGAVIGTLGGAAARARLAASFGQDWPAALIEDVIAIVGAGLLGFVA